MQFTIEPTQNYVNVNQQPNQVDCSSVNQTIRYINWDGSTGLIVYQDTPTDQTIFLDPSPYQNVINSWMTNSSNTITLSQAISIKSAYVEEIFQYKRNQPITFDVTAGNYSWSASNSAVEDMSVIIGTSAFAGTNAGIGSFNSSFTTNINSTLANLVSTLTTAVNVAMSNNISQLNRAIATITGALNYYETHDGGAIPIWPSNGYSNTTLVQNTNPITSITIANVDSSSVNTTIGTANSNIAVGNVAWTPIGSITPVQLTGNEFLGLASAIETRTASLLQTKFQKQSDISAQTTIQEIIVYDVTAGWSY